VAIPQNSPKGSALFENSTLLAPTQRATPVTDDDLAVQYRWSLDDASTLEDAHLHLPILEGMTAELGYLGRAEDRVEVDVSIADDLARSTQTSRSDRWHPTTGQGDSDLWLPRAGTTDALVARHTAPVSPRERKPPTQRHLHQQPYSRDSLTPRLPVSVAVFQLFSADDDPDSSPLACDQEGAGRWRAMLRDVAIGVAKDESQWESPELALELVSGHPAGKSSRTNQPHLAFVPLPSFNATGTADGRVRRIALVGYALPGVADRAKEIYETIATLLDGQKIDLGGVPARLRRASGNPSQDKIWSQLIRSGRVWHSLTPVALARGFKVPKFAPDGARQLSSNERYRVKLAEWSNLLRDSLGHVALPEPIVASCEITLTASPLLPGTERAERYRPPGETAVLTHVRLEFAEPVRGPLIIGDRRYFGFGLLSPE
jgi:CRISPR-associated protein Csb2